MKELKLDGFLLTHPPDLAYLTNFTGDDSVGLITEKDFFLVTDFRYQEQAEHRGRLAEGRDPRREDVRRRWPRRSPRRRSSRVGFEANFTTVGQIDALDKALKELKNGRASRSSWCRSKT